MISSLVDGIFGALFALLVAVGLAGQGGAGQAAAVPVAAVASAGPTAAPTATPATAPTEAPAGAEAEFSSYVAQILDPLSDLRDSFESMSDLMQVPYVTDDQWRKDANAAFDGIQAAHQALLQVEPPARLAEVHTALTAGTEKCSQGAEVARISIEEDSVVGLYAAVQLLTACSEEVKEAGQMLTELGSGE